MGNCCKKDSSNLEVDFQNVPIQKNNRKRDRNQFNKYQKDLPTKAIGKQVDDFPELPENVVKAINKQISSNPLKKPAFSGKLLPPYFIIPYNGFYQGEWKDGIPHGKGKFYVPKSFYYQGVFNQGQPTGQDCFFVYLDGSYKRGNMKEAQMEGKGKFYYSINQLSYEGEWLEDKPHGQGIERYKDGGFYKGTFVKGKKQGENVSYNWCNGKVFTGQFKNGKMNGKGKIKMGEGKAYCQGVFVNNLLEGEAVMRTQLGLYEGNFKRGNMDGKGKFTWNDGRIYQGDFKKGMLDGQGHLTLPNGQKYQGNWHQNKNKQLRFLKN